MQIRLNQREILSILKQVVSAVKSLHLHSPPIVHRDLKIENILISENYKLTDFGSATSFILPPNGPSPATSAVRDMEVEVEKYTTIQYRPPELCDLWHSKGGWGCPIDIWVTSQKVCYSKP
jgi:serine/threonine protein kinase